MLSTSILDKRGHGSTRIGADQSGGTKLTFSQTQKGLLHSTRQNSQKQSGISSDNEHDQQGTERKGRQQIKGARETADNQLKKAADFGNQQQRKEKAGQQYGVRERRRNY